ncbi:hypothetical protein BGZ96_009502 [Linnemannia gamsii]|uniref:Telomerase reverse transcriptase n=1 Tax=Linnemannia gamsii TaxID=64522 RepID=A0ABQ7KCF2_9FUNG|nr:hypothetical protein BGZ96_009502 [Linnemannia gamsii]
MPESHTAITNAVLLTLLPNLQRLGQFLDAKLNGHLTVVCSDDPVEYKDLLHDTLIAPTPAVALKVAGIHAKPFPTENMPCPDGVQDAVVNMAIDQTCAPTREWFNGKYNILTAGYRNSRRSSGQRAQKYHENTLETFVRSAQWETLLQRIGQPVMLYLLTQTSIFAALPNNCYCQITGPSISEQAVSKMPIQRHVLQCLSSRKRPADHATSYTTSDDNSNTGDLIPDQKSIMDAQMKRMFPKQYGLENVFSPTSQSSLKSISYASLTSGTFKSDATKAKKATGNWRLRSMRTLVEEMLASNQKCRFKALLQYYCPVEVTSFVHAIVKKIIPLAMFGSTDNRAVILRAMTRFIRLRKFETMPLQYILQGFKLSECTWLEDPKLGQERSSVAHTPPTASDKKHEILHEFIFWLFDGFLMPLLQATFYVTDSSYQRNKVFYYRHGLWRLITQSAVNSIQGNMFIKMEPEEVVTCNKVYSKVRFLPKTHDLRPIINLRRKAPRLVSGGLAVDYKSMNQRLNNAFLILAYERSRKMACSSAMGMSDLFYRLKQVKEKLVTLSAPKLPQLYMVKVDIKKSFDSINQENLLEIIDQTLKEDKYIIHRHSKVMPANGRMMKRFYPKATAPDEMPSFLDFARGQAEISKHAVLVDKVVHTTESKDVVIKLIKDHIQENIVKFGRHFYKQTTGIPQGSVLSPALCRFFYDEMENSVLSHLTQTDDSALIRLADDFLYISQRKDKATEFLTIMSQGHPEFGCFINEHKTIANFEVSLSDGQPVQQSQGNGMSLGGSGLVK